MNASKSENKCWIGFDLGGTKMLAQAFDSKFYSLGRERERTRGHEGAEIGLRRMSDLIKSVLSSIDIASEELGGIGIGVPGPLDLNKGIILDAPNLGWQYVQLKDFLESEFRCPTVIMNDVDAGVYGEYKFGAGRNSRCALGIFPGTGIGGGCVYEGEILRGKTGSCFEVGHMQVFPDGPYCGCGRQGCLEAVASRLTISAQAAQAAYRGDAPHLMEQNGTDISNIRSKALARSIEAGDVAIQRIIKNAAGYIGIVVGNLVNLLAPDKIILGGGLVEAMPDLYVKNVAKAANRRVMPPFENSFEVVPAQLGDESAVMGAAAWAQHVIAEEHSK